MSKKNILLSTVSGVLTVTISVTVLSALIKNSKIKQDSPYSSESIVFDANEDVLTTFFEEDSIALPDATTSPTSVYSEKKEDIKEDITTTKYNETTKPDSDSKKTNVQVIDDYNMYLNNLNEIIKNKNFPSDASNIIINSFNRLYNNYDAVYSVYNLSSVPNKDEMINIFFASLNQLNSIVISDNTETIPSYEIESNSMFIGRNNNPDNENQTQFTYDQFIHELFHAYQVYLGQLSYFKVSKCRIENPGLYYILFEGDCNVISSAMNSCIRKDGYGYINNGNESLCFYGKTFDPKYNMSYAINSMFMHLTSYDDMQNFKESFDTSEIANRISSNRNFDKNYNPFDFVNKCCSVCKDVNKGNTSTKTYEDLTYIYDAFLACISNEIKNLNSRDEVFNYMNYFRYFLNQEFVNYINYNDRDYYSNIEEKFNIDSLKDELFQKCSQYGVLDDRTVFDGIFEIEKSHNMMKSISIKNASITYTPTGYYVFCDYEVIGYNDGQIFFDEKSNFDQSQISNAEPLFGGTVLYII